MTEEAHTGSATGNPVSISGHGRIKIRWFKLLALLVLLLAAVPEGVGAQGPQPLTPPQPMSWANFSPQNWEYVDGGHWLAVWSASNCYNQHYTPGDWQTCGSGYGCISNWTWWLSNPSKLGVPSTWRSVWPGAQTLNNYIATCYFN